MLRTGTRMPSVSVEDPTPYCQCQGCKLCYIWAGHGKGCCQKRARSDRHLPLAQMRCTACARLRDTAAQEAAGAGEPEEAQEAARAGEREEAKEEVQETAGAACRGPAGHRPTKKRKGLSAEEEELYDLFYAIEAGCKPCVCHLLHERKVGALTPSKTQRYTAVDFAEWAEQHAKGGSDRFVEITAIVREAAGLDGPPHSLGQTGCLDGPIAHRPKKKRRDMSAEETQLCDLFYAITAGCKLCVRYLLHDVGVSAVAPSKTQGHTAVDFAEWAEKNAGDEASIERAEITAMVRARAAVDAGASLNKPFHSEKANRMMLRMGWAPGQPLGATGVGLMTPLRPFERAGRAGLASREDRAGLPLSSVFVRGGVLPAGGDEPPDGLLACMSLEDER